ncbi:hypothetical protein [Lactobacillus sp. PSON]|uniref:hypothetical protein n=1 Tax=Lactobacillus sp. PSON TaxID=3455454 RepID=UPI004042BAE2
MSKEVTILDLLSKRDDLEIVINHLEAISDIMHLVAEDIKQYSRDTTNKLEFLLGSILDEASTVYEAQKLLDQVAREKENK